jgi:hypothetical protein
MAKNETKRLSASVLDSDEKAFAALQEMTDYTPVNPAYTTEAVAEARAELRAAREAEVQAAAAANAARDNAVAKEWRFHNLVLGTRDQVTAQFGRNSNQVQAVGRKKTSEYKSRTRKPKTPKS